uniref:Ovule protein n=1 Tax=Meloidogyne hapla TaxID=6305 RepID=A0A1I8BHS9_MELHA
LTVRHKIDNCSSTEEFDKLYADVPLCENTNNKHRYAQRIAPCNCICICRICICAEVININ